ncbi:hypothetical protein D5086_031888 [Populus alba]|uniref:Uncharacterized protein n=1 Tax=Populus alba TaxID=43335 RepID=A0ACC4AJT0_POPAL
MDDNSGSKLTGIRQIVRLKEILQKWQSVTIGSKETSLPRPPSDQPSCGIPPAINNRLNSVKCCDSDEESCHSPEPPADVPKGYLAVYVGPELRRFIIPTSYLSHSLFKVLLCMENHPKDHEDEGPVSEVILQLKMLLLLKSNRTGLFGPDFRTDSGSKAGCPCRHV